MDGRVGGRRGVDSSESIELDPTFPQSGSDKRAGSGAVSAVSGMWLEVRAGETDGKPGKAG